MENSIIIAILLAVIVIALLRVKKHFSGGCCSSGSTTVRSHKKLSQPELGRFTLLVEGMHCENCRNRVEQIVNRLDGVVCSVNLRKKTALITYSREVTPEEIIPLLEGKGYKASVK